MPFKKGHPFYGDLSKSNYFQKGEPSRNKGGYKIKDTSKMKGKVTSQQGFQKGNHPKTEFKKGIHPETEFKKGEHRSPNTEFKKGEKHSQWQGGKSFEPYSVDWTETLKRSIRERDKYTCQLCNIQQGDRAHSVHHIDYDKENCNPDNLIALCRKCHIKTNYNREYWTEYFQGKDKRR